MGIFLRREDQTPMQNIQSLCGGNLPSLRLLLKRLTRLGIRPEYRYGFDAGLSSGYCEDPNPYWQSLQN